MRQLLMLVALLGTVSCGTLARERVLMPAMGVALDRVIAPAIAAAPMGEASRKAVDEKLELLSAALDSGNRAQADLIRRLWGELEGWAQAGIDSRVADGEISEGVAGSKRETLRQFGLRAAQL